MYEDEEVVEEYGYEEFLDKFGIGNDPNKPLEEYVVHYCNHTAEDREDFDLWEFGKHYEVFNILCRNLAVKHLEEKGYDISNCVEMFSGIIQTYDSLFKFDVETRKYKYIGK